MTTRATKTITFRIDQDLINKIENESKRREINLNRMVNEIFRNYVEWDMLEPQAGMIPVAKAVVAEIFRNMEKEQVISLAKQVGKNATYDIILFMKKGKVDLDSFLSWLKMWLSKNSTAGFNHTVEDDNIHTYIMKHDLGENWSLYHKIVLEFIFNEVLNKPLNISISEEVVCFNFKY